MKHFLYTALVAAFTTIVLTNTAQAAPHPIIDRDLLAIDLKLTRKYATPTSGIPLYFEYTIYYQGAVLQNQSFPTPTSIIQILSMAGALQSAELTACSTVVALLPSYAPKPTIYKEVTTYVGTPDTITKSYSTSICP